MQDWPTVSIVTPTYNEAKNIGRCLDAIFSQDYPRNKIEVWVVDNYSTDQTVALAKKYPVKIIYNRVRDAQLSKMLAFKKARGDLFCYIDADYKLRGRDWLKKMAFPLADDVQITGSFTRYLVAKKDHSLSRFLSYDLFQRDPIFKFFSIEIEKIITEKRKGYSVCDFQSGRIPPVGICLFRRRLALKTAIAKKNKLMELDNLEIFAKAGYHRFAFVPQAGYYHRHVASLRQLVKKRMRNIERNYFYDYGVREYTWVNFSRPRDLLKIIFWVIYANLFFPALVKALGNVWRQCDWACLWEPVVALVVTDVTIYEFLVLFLGIKKVAPCRLKTVKRKTVR
ncbi:hypothetical protein COU97_01170 [Candidatus Shapirobacteria bacterium CG10_big_fil_rev_8_21_14_0_10_48_15]|uniref:Glycosyltransferase 2-like domain-containing protein n=1 Tax=Candidatus Shapirobacteria bacterium CG10_big_fil_rev_8_21_14_0_10_48_15 TaxID=1974484 RepID=A0A2M8L7D6_9BACT|nr:MAG: hypothetical protein COU97_01170 [Candidatus Shapirobacteria bacterium CG10_big_fil_rev_8_21_14_0_10_48_15]